MMRILLIALLLAGCVDFEALPTTGAPFVKGAVAYVSLRVTQPVDAADTLEAGGWVIVQPTPLRYADDTLRVLGRPVAPKPAREGLDHLYDTTLVLAPGALGRGAADVRLPVPQGTQFIPAAFLAPLWVRSGPAKLAVARGADLVFPITSGPLPAELASEGFDLWRLEIRRGTKSLNVQSTGAVPERVVIPGASVPDDTARLILAELTVSRALHRSSRSDSTRVQFQGHSTVRWTVEVAP